MNYHEKQYSEHSKDNTFREFRKICCLLAEESSYLGKTSILHKFLLKASSKKIVSILYMFGIKHAQEHRRFM